MVKTNKITVAFLFFILSTVAYSQTPGFNYQALILDNTEVEIPGEAITSKRPLALENVIMRFSIESTNTILYTETHDVVTDENGMISVIVGEGVPVTSTFDQIAWDGELKYLNVEINIVRNNEGFTLLDSQKIVYLPQEIPENTTKIVYSLNDLTEPHDIGEIVLVKNYNATNQAVFVIWNGEEWLAVSGDSSPIIENAILQVANAVDRDNQFPNPEIGDQVWNRSCSCVQVFNGTSWISTSNISALNGVTKNGDIIKLGGALTEPTEITTSPNNTLAIKNLEESNLEEDLFVKIDATTGVLKRSTVSSVVKQEEAIIYATNFQLNFTTPLPITDPKKIDVYRNGVKIDFTVLNNSTIKLEQDAICYENDKIRIVQLY